jgi:osmoprotectant transport system substrate-binding protein
MAKGRLLAVLLMLIAALAVGCGDDNDSSGGGGGGTGSSSSSDEQPGAGKPAVTIGTKDFTEEFVLGQLYAQALEAKGYKVNLKENIGATEIIDKALTSGQIDGYPEYTGVSLSVVAKDDTLAKSPEETQQLVKEFYEKRGQAVSEATPFQDTDAIATTKEFAEKNNLKSVADLKDIPTFTLGARPEFKNRFNGTTSSSSSSRSACSTRRWTRAASTRSTCSRPTRSWPRASTRCSRIRRACSASRTSTSSSTRTSSTSSAAMSSWA